MIKCVKFIAFLTIIMVIGKVHGRPQVKDTFGKGVAASDNKEFENFSAKIKNKMDVGFGDAIRSKRSNTDTKEELDFNGTTRLANVEDFTEPIGNSQEKLKTKRAADYDSTIIDNTDDSDYFFSSSSSSSSSSESEETGRRKRFAIFEQFTEDMKKKIF